MKKILLAAAVYLGLLSGALAQSTPGLYQNQVPTPGQWNSYFAAKQDLLGYLPLPITGGTMTGELITSPSTANAAGFNLPPGVAPTAPVNGDVWSTATGLFARNNGVTVPLTGGSSASFAGTSPITVSFPAGVVTYACATCGVTGSPLSQFAATTSAQLAGIISDKTGSGAAVFAASPTLSGTITAAAANFSGAVSITSSATNALSVGLNGATNPALNVDASTASSATGIRIKSAVATGGVGLSATSSGTNESLTVDALGAGTISIGGTSTGAITLSRATTLSGALTYGGVTLNNAVTGTGNMVLSAAPSITGHPTIEGVTSTGATGTGNFVFSSSPSIATLTVTTAFNATGLVTYADMASAAIATQANYFAGASSVLVPGDQIYQPEITITFGATTTFDFNTFINAIETLTGNVTTQTVTNAKAGKAGSIAFVQDATGSRTTVWNSVFKFPSGAAPILSTAANAIDVLFYSCRSATVCPASLVKDIR